MKLVCNKNFLTIRVVSIVEMYATKHVLSYYYLANIWKMLEKLLDIHMYINITIYIYIYIYISLHRFLNL